MADNNQQSTGDDNRSETQSLVDQTELVMHNVINDDDVVDTSNAKQSGKAQFGILEDGESMRLSSNSIIANVATIKDVEEFIYSDNVKLSGTPNGVTLPMPTSPDMTLFDRFNKTKLSAHIPSRLIPDVQSFKTLGVSVKAEALLLDENNKLMFDGGLGFLDDSHVYPVMYNCHLMDNPLIEVRGRTSLAMFPSNVNPNIINKINATYDPSAARAWQNAYRLKNEEDAMWIVRNRSKSAAVGDNHTLILFKALCYYFDSLYMCLEGVVPARGIQRLQAYHFNVVRDTNWIAQISDGSREVINCIGMPAEYVSFWTYCCTPKAEVFSALTGNDGQEFRSVYSMLNVKTKTKIATVSDLSFETIRTSPSWFGRPHTILSFIDMYVAKFGLGHQLNVAYQIAAALPTLAKFKAPIAIPEPLHSADWFEGQIDAPKTDSPIPHLLATSSTSAILAQCVVSLSVDHALYTLTSAVVAGRTTPNVLPADKQIWTKFWVSVGNRIGAVPKLVINKLLSAPDYLVEYIGWSNAFLNIFSFLPPLTQDSFQVPFNIQGALLIASPYVVNTVLPYKGYFEFKALVIGHYWLVDYIKYSEAKRLGFTSIETIKASLGQTHANSPPGISRPNELRVPLSDVMVRRVAEFSSTKIFVSTRLYIDELEDYVDSIDPLDSRVQYEDWNLQGVSTPSLSAVRGGRSTIVEVPAAVPTETVSSESVKKATNILDKVMAKHIKNLTIKENQNTSKIKTMLALDSNAIIMEVKSVGALVVRHSKAGCYDPPSDGNCGWLCLQKVLELENKTWTLAQIQRVVNQGRVKVKVGLDTINFYQMCWIVKLLQIDAIVSADMCGVTNVFTYTENYSPETVFIDMVEGHWLVRSNKMSYKEAPLRKVYQCGIKVPAKHVSSVGRGPYNHWPLPVRVQRFREYLSRYNAGVVKYDDLVEEHSRCFPKAEVPRYMAQIKENEMKVMQGHGIATESWESIFKVVNQRFKEAKASIFNKEFFDKSKIQFREKSTSNKNNLTIHEMYKIVISDRKYCGANTSRLYVNNLTLQWLWDHKIQASEFVASVALWLYTLTLSKLGWRALLGTRFMEWTEDNWLQNSKAVHDDWRKHGVPFGTDDDWSQLLYMQALYGRGGVEVDWTKEFGNKATPPDDIVQFTGREYSASLARQTIKEAVYEVLATAIEGYTPKTFDMFMDEAYEWLVSGSSAGIPSVLKFSEMRDYLIKELGLYPRPTKRSVMEAISREKVLSILETDPKVVSKAHMKLNETGGKARAIYGVTIWHYIYSNWLMAPLEKHIRHPYIDINIPNAKFVEQLMERSVFAKQQAVFSSYDYPDFNSMHTHQAMEEIYQVAEQLTMPKFERLYGKFESYGIALKTFEWLRKSTYKQVVLHPETGMTIATVGGLYSGNRDTTLINTLLNVAYSKIVDRSLLAAGVNPEVEMRRCHGDDIITVHSTYESAQAWNEMAEKCNLKGQESKLLTERSYHEYLRVLGTKKGSLRGCLARTCATFVNGNWETDREIGFDAKFNELYTNLNVLERRGAKPDKCHIIWKYAFARASRRFKWSDQLTQRMWNKTCGSVKQQEVSIKNKDLPGDKFDYAGLPDHVTGPYLNKLERSLPEWAKLKKQARLRLKRKLQQATYGTELPVAYQQTQLGDMQLKVRTFKEAQGKVRPVDMAATAKRAANIATDLRARQRIKAYHLLLQEVKLESGFSAVDLISYLTGIESQTVRTVLETNIQTDNAKTQLPKPKLASEPQALLNQFIWAERAMASIKNDEIPSDIIYLDSEYNECLASEMFKY